MATGAIRTPIFRFLQVPHPLDRPGTPTMVWSVIAYYEYYRVGEGFVRTSKLMKLDARCENEMVSSKNPPEQVVKVSITT
jgi:hypothetical protein